MIFNTFLALLRREYWEHRFAFVRLPILIGGIFLFFTILAVIWAEVTGNRIDPDGFFIDKINDELGSVSRDVMVVMWQINFALMSAMMNFILFFVVLFFMLGTLKDDRKDRSILFWKSLPVSDTQTVLSKLVTGSFLVPFYWAMVFIVFYTLLLMVASFIFLDTDISIWRYIWSPANPPRDLINLMVAYFIQGFWLFPIWAYCLMMSAFAKGRPFLWAILPIIFIAGLQLFLSQMFYLNLGTNLVVLLGKRLLAGTVPFEINVKDDDLVINATEIGNLNELDSLISPFDWGVMFSRFTESGMWWGILIGALFLSAAIYMRRFRNED